MKRAAPLKPVTIEQQRLKVVRGAIDVANATTDVAAGMAKKP